MKGVYHQVSHYELPINIAINIDTDANTDIDLILDFNTNIILNIKVISDLCDIIRSDWQKIDFIS